VAGHLAALVPGQREPLGGRDSAHGRSRSSDEPVSAVAVGQVHQTQEPGPAVDQSGNGGPAARADDQFSPLVRSYVSAEC